jgi:thioredoxin reductase
VTDVLVIGAGPTGLTAAAGLAERGIAVRVVDRDEEPGGVPRSSDHPGYGVIDMRRMLSGPEYARRLTDRAVTRGAHIDVRATVTGLRPRADGGADVDITSPAGRESVSARAVLLATGCRERPRSARLVAGSRPSGVLTTGWLQRLVHLDHRSPGRRAVVVGAEHVSYSAVVTLAEAGCTTAAMVTDADAHASFAAFDRAARLRYRFPLLTRTHLEAIHGSPTVTGVTVVHEDGRRAHIACDTVVFTGDWYPENTLAVAAGLHANPRTHSPATDTGARTQNAGIFATGNLVHPASTAHACAQDGARAVTSIAGWLADGRWPESWTSIEVESPLEWSAPDSVAPGEAAPLRLQSAAALNRPRLTMTQGSRTLWRGRVPWVRPARPFSIPGTGLTRSVPGHPIVIRID